MTTYSPERRKIRTHLTKLDTMYRNIALMNGSQDPRLAQIEEARTKYWAMYDELKTQGR